MEKRRRIVRAWLLAVAALVFAVVLVGGATRLTGSGLSIVEWRPVTGVLPPLSENEWRTEFEKYRTIPQYQQINRGMSLGEFKTIYWWEWTHRLLGRFIGVAFLLPFLWFLWWGWIEPHWRARLWGIFALGALQGAVGWWMVASGLAGRVSVSQYRLAFHLTLACVIYAALIWMGQEMRPRAAAVASRRMRASALALLALVLLQIYIGALVAGLDAGLVYNTWPEIDGALVPAAERLWFLSPAWRNLFENALTVQFSHRMMAYLLWALSCLHAVHLARGRQEDSAITTAGLLALAITVQAFVGIATLLMQAPLVLALAHQALAVGVLTLAVLHAQRLAPQRRVASAAHPALSPT
ncbi:MAG TPA: COX15/CtaA family protein [Woeseiaceae bacterium]|nr:COX15/CtaA family protein [Woeseiaceae bacterium]